MITKCNNSRQQYKLSSLWLSLMLWVLLALPVYGSAPTIYSQTGIIIEASTGKVLYEKNPDQGMQPASMTKVMTAYITMEEIAEGNLSLDTEILVTANHAYLASGAVYFPGNARTLQAGNYETVETLLRLIFSQSASAPCLMLAEHISGTEAAFVVRMNQTAERLSMLPNYENCHGVYAHYVTARDQARLLQEFMVTYPLVFDYCATPTFYHRGLTYGVVSQIINPKSSYYIPDATGFKIGATTSSGKCLSTTVERDGVTLIIVTFNSSTLDQMYQDHHKLVTYGFAQFAKETSYFYDLGDFQPLEEVYETFRASGIHLQAKGGYVRPTEQITLGEFSQTFISALEAVGLLEEITPVPVPYVWDLTNAYRKDLLYRGIAQEILPVSSSDSFSPTVTMPQQDILTLFTNAREVLPPLQTSLTPLYGGWELEQDGTLSRGNALLLILGFLQDYGYFTDIGNYRPKTIASSWALDNVESAVYFRLVPDSFSSDFTPNITREQTAQLLVTLLEVTSGQEIPTPESNPFTDTDSLEVQKAYDLGMVYGTDVTTFSPELEVTRQELAVMLQTTLGLLADLTHQTVMTPTTSLTLAQFEDVSSIATWAKEPFQFLLERELLTGVSETRLAPTEQASIEQCVTLCYMLFLHSFQ